ncbi:hypothetical protein CDD80_471 [Ophiocordyceps camponoti-rufipedis]|uniref:Uncharacterized protein n=1 Tax=Ophiocordyceps camponoti-rufipedis TaxID=2004952 RepID=A0A2C5Z6W1_9HYPO|nr:hypothetical protein CDD80_471 [Ophiocordyceps camponoti-rufipedis]
MAASLPKATRCPRTARQLATTLVQARASAPTPLLLPPRLPAATSAPALVGLRFKATTLHHQEVKPSAEKEPDPNKVRLGATLRVLQDRLPTLLQSPLPQHLLAPNISLQLFPTTHPHLPTVSGRVAYNAALWTSPIAWNRVPIIGNVKLDILSSRLTKDRLSLVSRRPSAIPEQLVVRWCEKTRRDQDDEGAVAARRFLWPIGRGVDPNKAFSGLFIFDFDVQGRILTHTIEQAQDGGDWEAGVGAKFIGLTDWLLGEMSKPRDDSPVPVFEKLEKKTT